MSMWQSDPVALSADKNLCKWARQYVRRDEVIRGAVAAGVSIHRVHEVTGIARTTITRIVESPAEPARRVPTAHADIRFPAGCR